MRCFQALRVGRSWPLPHSVARSSARLFSASSLRRSQEPLGSADKQWMQRMSGASPAEVEAFTAGGSNHSLNELASNPQFKQDSKKFGHSEDDAFGELDPLLAVVKHGKQEGGRRAAAEEAAAAMDAREARSDVDAIASARNRRRNRRKRTMDAILGDVLHDALKLRDMGQRPTADFVYKKTQERAYEEEYGRKPPSATDHAAKYVPFPPDLHLHRLIPLNPPGVDDVDEERDTRHGLHRCHVLPDDPWPERAITTANPVWTRRMHAEDELKTKGKGYAAYEDRMYNPRERCDLGSELLDAMDELAFWEEHLLTFLREAPLPLRRTLPYLHEYYRFAVHRTIRAEKRYMRCRDAVLVARKASTALFSRSEAPVERVRGYYGEAHRSLSSPNYDPARMKKSVLAPLMQMTEEQFAQWKVERKEEREALLADLTA